MLGGSSRRVRRLVVVTALMLGAVPAAAHPASAALGSNPDSTWMTNGTVYAIAQAGNTIYIGGKFTALRRCPTGVSCPGGVIQVNNVAAIDATTGAGIKTWTPDVTGGTDVVVSALAAAGGKVIIGGKFRAVDGVSRFNFAAVDQTSGAVDPNVDAVVGSETSKGIRALLATDTRVYAGGYFGTVDGVSRKHLAAFELDGTLDPVWRPRTSQSVRSLTLACDGQTIFAGGIFREASGSGGGFVGRESIARFDVTSGALHPWAIPAGTVPNNLVAWSIDATCSQLFGGYGGQNWLYSFDLTDDVGERLWERQTAGNVQAVSVYDDQILFGGHFSQVTLPGNSKVKRTRFASADFDGNLNDWAPTFEGKFYGPWDIYVNEETNQIYVGGQFTQVSAVQQLFLARFTDA
jgi:beta-propeller uncharacterized protein DUF5122